MHSKLTTLNTLYSLLLVLFGASSWALSQCANNVSILDGETINFCGNVPNHLNASPGFNNYNWVGNVQGQGEQGLITGTGWIYVIAQDSDNCTSIDSAFVSFWLINSNPSINSSNGLYMCENGGSTILSVNAYNPVSYQWSTGSTSSNIDVTTPGIYSVNVYDQNGCYMTDSIEILPAEFTVEAVGGNSICTSQSVTLVANGGTSYTWSTGETSNQISVAPTTRTDYQVTISDGSCIETVSITIDAHQLPSHSMPDTLFLMPGEVGYVTAPSGLASYQWDPPQDMTAPTGATPGFRGMESADVLFIGQSATTGCTLYHNIRFQIINLTIPDGFSPNGDGKNDFFVIPEIIPYQASLKVWNRWGDIVYEADKYANLWDGTCQGNMCAGNGNLPEGTYFYTLEVKGRTITGTITLKR